MPIDELIFAILLSFPLSLLLSKAIQEKWLLSLAKRMSVTNKFGDDDLWTFFLNSRDVYWVFIRDQDNQLIYFGAVSYFSGPEKRRELVLSDVTVFFESDGRVEELYSKDSIYLDLHEKKFVIELVTDKDE